MLRNKLMLLSPIIALAVVFIFSLTLFPTTQLQPRGLPIAIVNEDQGVDMPNQQKVNIGQTIVDRVQESSKTEKNPAVKWVEVQSVEVVRQGLDNQKYYAAFVIPEDFSAKQASLQTPKPSAPEVQIYINQGMNMAAATLAGQIVNGVVDQLNDNLRVQLLKGLELQDTTLTVEQASHLAEPITKKVTNVNEVGNKSMNGNSPVSLFQPVWIASIASAAIIFLAVRKMPVNSRKEKLVIKAGQIVMGAVIALVMGFGFTWIAAGTVGLNIPNFMDTALFLTITSFSFFLMILAVLSLVGLRGIPIFPVTLFFGAPLLALAPEMMSPFYRDWIYSWLPMRFMVAGLRELFFFGKELSWNTPVSVLVSIGAASMILMLGTALRHHTVKGQITEAKS